MTILSHSAKTDLGSSKEKIQNISADITQDFRNFVNDVESLLKETASLTGDELAQAKIKLNQRIIAAKQRINMASSSMIDDTRNAAIATNEYVHEKPWPIIGVGTVVGFALGMLAGRK